MGSFFSLLESLKKMINTHKYTKREMINKVKVGDKLNWVWYLVACIVFVVVMGLAGTLTYPY